MTIRKSCALAVFAVGLLAEQAFAGAFTLDKYEAMLLHKISVSAGDVGLLFLVTDDLALYGPAMQGEVGYWGLLQDSGSSFDLQASMRIGAAGTAALDPINAAGSYTHFELFLGNDDDDPWAVQLYAEAGGVTYSSGFTTLPAGANTTLTLDFGGVLDFAQVTDIGFDVLGNFSGSKPSNPDNFRISIAPTPAVPVPGAALLTLLGVGACGVIRRKLV